MANFIIIGDKVLRLAFQQTDRAANYVSLDFRLEPSVPEEQRKLLLAQDCILFPERVYSSEHPDWWNQLKDATRDQVIGTLYGNLARYWPMYVAFVTETRDLETDVKEPPVLTEGSTAFLVAVQKSLFGRTAMEIFGWKLLNAPEDKIVLAGG